MIQYEEERFGNTDYIEYAKHKNFSFPMHFHRCLEFIYMIEGEIDILYDNKQITLHQGDTALFLPNDIHGFTTKNNSYFVSLVFAPELVTPFMKQVEGKKAVSPVFQLQERFLNEALIDFPSCLSHLLKTKGILLLICGNFLDQVKLSESTTSHHAVLHKIIDYVSTHFKEDIHLTSLAHALGYDPSYLSRFISKNMDTTFHKYLTQTRLTHAASLLETTNEKMIDIAMQSGFSSIRTFNGAFKKVYGLSPNEYKNR